MIGEPWRVCTYSTVAGRDLRLWFRAPDGRAVDGRPAVVFFHGGGWRRGRIDQFQPQADRLADRGLVTVLVEYRTEGPVNATQDATSAMRYVVEHAEALGADRSRVVAAGGSAGAHLALATALLDPPSPAPSALVLFNPVTDTTGDYPEGYGRSWFASDAEARRYSPYHHVRSGSPAALIMHGTADTTVSFENSVRFAEAMRTHGNVATLIGYAGQRHGFFNPGSAESDRYFAETTDAMERFLVRSGHISVA